MSAQPEEADVRELSELEKLGMTALSFGILAAVGGLISLGLWRLLPRDSRRLLFWPRWRPVTWTGLDVWVAFAVLLFGPALFAGPLERSGFFTFLYGAQAAGDVFKEHKALWVTAIAFPFQVGLILGWFAGMRGAPPARLGLTCRRAAQDVVTGYLTWLVLAPAALLLYWAVLLFVEAQTHPLEQLTTRPLLEVDWIVLALLALVTAPLMEELLFRGILLRWQLHRSLDAQVAVGAVALGVSILFGVGKTGDYNPGPTIFTLVMLPGYVLIPYLAARLRGQAPRPAAEPSDRGRPAEDGAFSADGPDGRPPRGEGFATWQDNFLAGLVRFFQLASEKRVNALLAMYSNGLLFAAFHASVWPTPIPLFLLGVGLAWLAYRTQSLVSTMVAHSLFNGVACLYLFLTKLFLTT
jgi:membrane protease YdiL (CAAX protease family)